MSTTMTITLMELDQGIMKSMKITMVVIMRTVKETIITMVFQLIVMMKIIMAVEN